MFHRIALSRDRASRLWFGCKQRRTTVRQATAKCDHRPSALDGLVLLEPVLKVDIGFIFHYEQAAGRQSLLLCVCAHKISFPSDTNIFTNLANRLVLDGHSSFTIGCHSPPRNRSLFAGTHGYNKQRRRHSSRTSAVRVRCNAIRAIFVPNWCAGHQFVLDVQRIPQDKLHSSFELGQVLGPFSIADVATKAH